MIAALLITIYIFLVFQKRKRQNLEILKKDSAAEKEAEGEDEGFKDLSAEKKKEIKNMKRR